MKPRYFYLEFLCKKTRELTYFTFGKGRSSTQTCPKISVGSVDDSESQESPSNRKHFPQLSLPSRFSTRKFLVTQWNLAQCFWRFGSINTNVSWWRWWCRAGSGRWVPGKKATIKKKIVGCSSFHVVMRFFMRFVWVFFLWLLTYRWWSKSGPVVPWGFFTLAAWWYQTEFKQRVYPWKVTETQ